jgi:Fe-Mn family superoxide dismutase
MPLAMAARIRSMHSIAPLEYNMKGEASNNGVGDFLSRDGFNIAWTQYQTHLLERLNAMTAGRSFSARPSLAYERQS